MLDKPDYYMPYEEETEFGYLMIWHGYIEIQFHIGTKRLMRITEINGYHMDWDGAGRLETLTPTRGGYYTGLYQTWSSGKRTEVSYSYKSVDSGEKYTFGIDKPDIVEFYDPNTFNINDQISKFFKNPLKPTKEEQMDVLLAHNTLLIPADDKRLRDINGSAVYE